MLTLRLLARPSDLHSTTRTQKKEKKKEKRKKKKWRGGDTRTPDWRTTRLRSRLPRHLNGNHREPSLWCIIGPWQRKGEPYVFQAPTPHPRKASKSLPSPPGL